MKVYWKKPITDNVLSMLTPHIAERKFQYSYSKSLEPTVTQPKPERNNFDRYLELLQNDSFVARAPGNAFAIEILEQRNGIFARNARQFLEFCYVDQPVRLMLSAISSQKNLQPLNRLPMKKHLAVYA